ncbi:uncharacterized protein Ecym_6119 [Eremothecium cymbalariae DBVPG|uniref:Transmembrane protein n=1 Tax=Eremothecium cymbalariae (strain CBS 270.75 / DBVPG 7215 / KCTC 17166 / NRRL Y-17582) TaxID=931890 RepID=G8JV33_ERECY|nr:hypothetical protein Ecym_6119 [Eremothecium cymbalariae DBVPG\
MFVAGKKSSLPCWGRIALCSPSDLMPHCKSPVYCLLAARSFLFPIPDRPSPTPRFLSLPASSLVSLCCLFFFLPGFFWRPVSVHPTRRHISQVGLERGRSRSRACLPVASSEDANDSVRSVD